VKEHNSYLVCAHLEVTSDSDCQKEQSQYPTCIEYSYQPFRIEQNRTKQKFQLEGTYNNHLVQPPDHSRADQKLKHVIKGIVQMPLEHGQAWGIDHISRKPVLVFDHPLGKEMLHNAQSKPPLTQL